MTVVELRDVTLRDGLQLLGRAPSTRRKVEIARELLALGVPALDVVDALAPAELRRCWVWVARG